MKGESDVCNSNVPSSISVIIVDDHPMVLEAIGDYLQSVVDIEVVASTSDGEEAVVLVQEMMPNVVLMDLVLDGSKIDGIEATRRITEVSPDTQVLALSAYDDDAYVFPVLKAGALGYLLKTASPGGILDAIRTIACQQPYLDLRIYERLHQYLSQVRGELVPPELGPSLFVGDDASLFLSAFLHQLSNTIVPVRDLVGLAKRSENPQHYLEMIEISVDRTIEMLRRLQISLTSWPLQVTDLLEVVSSAKEQISVPSNIVIEVDVSEEARLVRGNPQALISVFANLILNAIHAMGNRGSIVVKSQAVEGRGVEVRIIDTGCGIPVEAQGKLFEPFFTTKKKEGGQGLGLWLSKRLVERLGGTLTLEKSMPGEGSTFVIRLPLVEQNIENAGGIGEEQ